MARQRVSQLNEPQLEVHPERGGTPGRWGQPLDIAIAVALGLAAIATAGAVYLNEKQEHKATVKFNEAIHLVSEANGNAIRAAHPGPGDALFFRKANALNQEADDVFVEAVDAQERATRYTLAEVVVASALFLFGVAGVARSLHIKVGALATGVVIFLIALVLLATA